jgi:hypothetical protein
MSSPSKTIEILVSPTGETTVQTKGFAGSSCRDASSALEQALGLVQCDSPTAEMYQTQSVNQPLQQGNS